MAKSRRSYDDDEDREERSDDSRRRRRRGNREKDKPFPLVWILVLIITPLVLAGGYFGIKAIRKGGSSGQASAEEIKITRSKIVGDWLFDQGAAGRTLLKIREDGQITIDVSMPNAGRSITTSYEVVEASSDKITIRLAESVHDGGPVDLIIEVISDQQLRVKISTETLPPKIYNRQTTAIRAKK